MQVECKSEVISLKAEKIFVGATVSLALLINPLQVSAEEVETFGDEFEENDSEVVPFQEENDDLGPVLIFNIPDEGKTDAPANTEIPAVKNPEVKKVKNTPEKVETEEIVVEPAKKNPKREKVLRENETSEKMSKSKTDQLKGKRFVKVAIDSEGRNYYLDKQSVSWKRLPYSASEYILDCWVHIIERNTDDSDLPEYLSDYVNDDVYGELEIAEERKISLNEVDVDILKHKKYFLQHYYIRPKTKQIQFLCELEVVGNPQNTISEREYNYKNWENLIPGSVESMIYQMTMKTVGKSGSSDKGHMSVADMFDEYLRISIR